jgi:hypothetical protein
VQAVTVFGPPAIRLFIIDPNSRETGPVFSSSFDGRPFFLLVCFLLFNNHLLCGGVFDVMREIRLSACQ